MPRKLRNKPGYPERGRTESVPEGIMLSVVSGRPMGKDSNTDLMDRILSEENILKAVQRVVENRGAPGIDGMNVDELPLYVEQHGFELFLSLRTGRYEPRPVRRAEIPKPDGGKRELGVPTVADRMVQQAIAQVLTEIYEPLFSDSSYGFRPNRSAHDAVWKMKEYYEQGYTTAVDIDLSKYFDTLNHDILMNIIRQDIGDKTVITLIRKFLKSGVMVDGLVFDTERGSPQGGNLSPLLANIYLSRFDRLMESRGHPFLRYADDIMIFARSKKAGERIMRTATEFLEQTMKLKVNEEKSSVGSPRELKFLGFRIYHNGRRGGGRRIGVGIHPTPIERCKDRIRQITKKNTHVTMEDALRQLSIYFRGWVGYYGLADARAVIEDLTKWARRRIRAKYLKQWKRTYRRGMNIQRMWRETGYIAGYKKLWDILKNCHGVWNLSNNWVATSSMTNRYLESQGFPKMLEWYEEAHSRLLNRRIPTGTYGGVRGR